MSRETTGEALRTLAETLDEYDRKNVMARHVVEAARKVVAALTPAPDTAAPRGGGESAEDLFERYVLDGIARSPQPLRELGEYLTRMLDEDEWPNAERLLLQLATAPPATQPHDTEHNWRQLFANACEALAQIAVALDLPIDVQENPDGIEDVLAEIARLRASDTGRTNPDRIRQTVFNWLDTLKTGAQDRGAVQAGLVRDLCAIVAPRPCSYCDDEADGVHVDNPRGFTIRACFDGVEIEMRHEQAESLFKELRPWFEDDRMKEIPSDG